MRGTANKPPDDLNWSHSAAFLWLTGFDSRVTVRIYPPGRFSVRWYAQVTVQRDTWIPAAVYRFRGFDAEEGHWATTNHTLLGKDCEQWEVAVEACLDALVRLLWEEPSL